MSAAAEQIVSSQSAQTVNGGTDIGRVTESGGTRVEATQSFAASTTDGVMGTFAFVKANLRFISIISDQNATLKTNSHSSPQETINLIAGTMFRWSYSEGYFANPFAGNVTSGHIDCTPAAKIKFKILTDP